MEEVVLDSEHVINENHGKVSDKVEPAALNPSATRRDVDEARKG